MLVRCTINPGKYGKQASKHRELGMYLLNQLNASKQIHAEIYKLPDDAFSSVLFLFQHEHVMVKELLQLFVSEINAKLLKAVILQEKK